MNANVNSIENSNVEKNGNTYRFHIVEIYFAIRTDQSGL